MILADPIIDKGVLARAIGRWALIIIYLTAGMLHIAYPQPFMRIVPEWMPMHYLTVVLTGVAEIAGAIGLISPRFRRAAGIGLALYALCVWPANIKHAIDDLGSGTGLSIWYHAPRQLLQPIIIWWALWVGRATDWPFAYRNIANEMR